MKQQPIDIEGWVARVVAQEVSWHELPTEWSEEERATVRLAALEQAAAHQGLTQALEKDGILGKAQGKNCERMVGALTVPLGVAGPLKFVSGEEAFLPLATTEGALVASVQRGTKVSQLVGGVQVLVEDRGVTRAPVFVIKRMRQKGEILSWIATHEADIATVATATSGHLTLLAVEPVVVGRNLFLRLRFDTGEAMGMNMVTVAAEAVVHYLEEKLPVTGLAVSGNACVDKKPSWSNVLLGRGVAVEVEAEIPAAIVRSVLKTTPQRIAEVVMRKQWLGSAVSGSMGFNAHYANVVAAAFLATGQDIAHVVEGSVGITTAEVVRGGLYFSVSVPNLMVGTVGGGTHLPVQQGCLQLMGLGNGRPGDKKRLAQIIGGAVWCGELSLTAALASDDLGRAHVALGRKRTHQKRRAHLGGQV